MTAGVGEVDVDAVAAAVGACPAVAHLSGGTLGEIATYLPGRRVAGVVVRERDERPVVEVHVAAVWGPAMAQVAGQVRAAVQRQVPGVEVDVAIDDLVLPGEEQLALPAAGPVAAPPAAEPVAAVPAAEPVAALPAAPPAPGS